MSLSMSLMQGRCLCQSVRYELTAPFASAAHCHCESCRRANGAAFVSWGTVARSNFVVREGAAVLHRFTSSPGAARISCRACGSPLFMEYDNEPEWTYVTLASLSSAPQPPPDRHFSYEEHVPWLTVSDSLPRVRGKSTDSF